MTEAPVRVMTPLGDTVVLEMLPSPTQVRGVWLPDGARVRYDAALRARVVDVGPEVRDVRPGQEVLVVPQADGVEVTVPGTGHSERVRIVARRVVVAVVTEQRPPEALVGDLVRAWDALHEEPDLALRTLEGLLASAMGKH